VAAGFRRPVGLVETGIIDPIKGVR